MYASKADPYDKTELPLVDTVAPGIGYRLDLREPRQVLDASIIILDQIRNVAAWVGEMGCVGEIERLGAELDAVLLAQLEHSCQAEIHVYFARPAHRVGRHVAKSRRGDGGERQRIEIRSA